MAKDKVTIKIPRSEIAKLENALRKYAKSVGTTQAEQLFDKGLRKAVTPWQNVFNKGKMYEKLTMRTGKLKRPMGNRKIKGTRKGVYGRKVLPTRTAWYTHFFASPARQIRRSKRVDFYKIYSTKSRDVAKKVNDEITRIMQYLASINFK